jgi:hypothetical protein
MMIAAVAVVMTNDRLNNRAQGIIGGIVKRSTGAAVGIGGVQPLQVGEGVQLLDAVRGQVTVRGASRGSTRAAVALLIIALAALALAATLISGAPDAPGLRNTIISALLAVLSTVVGFYFGAKTAQENQSPAGSANGTPPPSTTAPVTLLTSQAVSLPQVGSPSPPSGDPGAIITLSGSGLAETREVRFGSVIATIVPGSATATSVQAIVPPELPGAPKAVRVTVVTPSGPSDPGRAPTFTYNP